MAKKKERIIDQVPRQARTAEMVEALGNTKVPEPEEDSGEEAAED